MWTREELKIRAKNVLRGCFWSAVVVALITGILTEKFFQQPLQCAECPGNQLQ